MQNDWPFPGKEVLVEIALLVTVSELYLIGEGIDAEEAILAYLASTRTVDVSSIKELKPRANPPAEKVD